MNSLVPFQSTASFIRRLTPKTPEKGINERYYSPFFTFSCCFSYVINYPLISCLLMIISFRQQQNCLHKEKLLFVLKLVSLSLTSQQKFSFFASFFSFSCSSSCRYFLLLLFFANIAMLLCGSVSLFFCFWYEHTKSFYFIVASFL